MKKKDREKRDLHIRIDFLLWKFEGETGMKVKGIAVEHDEDNDPGVKIELED